MADIVLPATMFLEHDDVYQGGGHQYILLGPQADRAAGRMPLQPRGDLRAGRSGSAREHPGFAMSAARTDRLDAAGNPAGARWPSSRAKRWIDCQPDFETAHYLNGFA